MTPATNRAARELPEPPVRPHLTLLDGRVRDSVLVGRALGGGPRGKAAEEELFRRYRPAVSRLAASFSELDPDGADDGGAEAFVRGFRAPATPKGRRRLAAWLLTIARNPPPRQLTSAAAPSQGADERTPQ